MIDLHYWTTPNGHKVAMFLEESALPYRIVPVNISKGDQFNRIPGDFPKQPHSSHRRSQPEGWRQANFGIRIRRYFALSR